MKVLEHKIRIVFYKKIYTSILFFSWITGLINSIFLVISIKWTYYYAIVEIPVATMLLYSSICCLLIFRRQERIKDGEIDRIDFKAFFPFWLTQKRIDRILGKDKLLFEYILIYESKFVLSIFLVIPRFWIIKIQLKRGKLIDVPK
ncbi:hypothetical protein [Mycoplasma procyoni]|uniref:hypothetical protein n=1 Tax=Mycoplasma procyoni TaxID=568784 RepID=UPI00197C9FDB|nr:hypothetical protein [Mycoplasma procyoni]MBN3534938.1 hypothetical protein [Mycoplasma procyoni]